MTNQIHVQAELSYNQWTAEVIAACTAALEQIGSLDVSVTIVLTDDDSIRKLNKDFAGENQVTDVLSFPLGEPDPENGLTNLGDVIIALPQAQVQSEEHGVSLVDELSLLAVHGTLHLLGFDHANAESRATMWAHQEAVLLTLGIAPATVERML